MVYNAIELADTEWCRFLHNTGWKSGDKQLKLFAIGRLQYIRNEARNSSVACQLVVSSPFDRTIQAIANGFLQSSARLGDCRLKLSSVEIKRYTVDCEAKEFKVKTCSPVVSYGRVYPKRSTNEIDNVLFSEGSWRRYDTPGDEFFERSIINNLFRKYHALPKEMRNEYGYDNNIVENKNCARIYTIGPCKKYVDSFFGEDSDREKQREEEGGKKIAWAGRFKLCLPAPLAQVAIDCGLGSLNSQGFGCVIPET